MPERFPKNLSGTGAKRQRAQTLGRQHNPCDHHGEPQRLCAPALRVEREAKLRSDDPSVLDEAVCHGHGRCLARHDAQQDEDLRRTGLDR